MTEGPIGGAAFGNEFGRPNILGMFRTLEDDSTGVWRGYHKPIMVAGGVGLIDAAHVEKKTPAAGDCVIQLGGPAMLIGLGGGAASSMDTGANSEDLDFASVQRDNPEMQRRCQELISRCISLGAEKPIISIHDVGAGGLSNACPELVADVGARFDLRAIHNDDPGMSPMQIWSNEAQERYVLVVGRADLDRFAELAARERCLFAVIGEITGDGTLSLDDELLGGKPIDDLDLAVILGKPPKMLRRATRSQPVRQRLDLGELSIAEAAERVLRFPAVAAKTFLITIADRTVTGLVARDQMVGPYQVPVADLALTCHSFQGYTGSAMAMGERTPLALVDAPTSGAHGHCRGHHQHCCGAYWADSPHQAVGQLDVCLRRGGRRCGPVRHRARSGVGVLPGSRGVDPGGQRLAVHAGGVGRRRGRGAQGGRTVEFGRLGLRAGGRCAPPRYS